MVAEIDSKQVFDEAIAADCLVVIDFYAEWCPPCKAIAPKIQAFSETYQDVKFYKVDVDNVKDVSAEVGIRAMPTFIFFKSGEKVKEVVGADPGAIQKAIQEHR